MTDQPGITKAELLEGLRATEVELLEKLRGLPADALEAGCYENGWNGRQVLAHITAIEWTYPKLVDLARNGPPEKKPDEPAHKAARGGINDYNDRSIERYSGATVAELLETFKVNRETTIATVEETNDDLLAAEVKSAGGIRGPLATVLNFVAVMHVRGHVNDIVAAASAKA
ncbi:MAG TPA: maleylpyruvate isomerase N-terminal domain-containing protein [Dehalococcoidia bacterium]|nr:maleylpyruvate isomerase N-terminal domain-containing protein [Dehalococcoidia bacterium]